MQFTKKQIFWMAFISVALQGATSLAWSAIPIPHQYSWVFTFGASAISYFQGLILWIIGSQGVSVPGEGKPFVPPPAVKPVLMMLAITGALLVSMFPASAATAAPNDADILSKIVADANVALADANTNNDTIAATCYKAVADIASAKLNTAQVSGAGLLAGFQKVRDVTRLNASPQGTELIVGCAPLVQDAKLNFVQFFTKIGAVILLKGIIPLP